MITLVPAAREAVAMRGSVAVWEQAKIGVASVVMHSMGFPLMAEKAGVG